MLASRRLRATLLRILQAFPVVVGVVVISFVLTRALPGYPAVHFAGAEADEQSIGQVRIAMGLDKPILQRFVVYGEDLLRGDLGQSLSTGRPVTLDLATLLPASSELTLTALLLAILIAVPLGVLAATRPGSWVDHVCRVVVTAGGVTADIFYRDIADLYPVLSAGDCALALGTAGIHLPFPRPHYRFLPDRCGACG